MANPNDSAHAREMRLNERWVWLGEPNRRVDCGFHVFRAHPDAFWIALGEDAVGPFDARSILRAVRMACTPAIDGCELAPPKLGFSELEPRGRLRRGPQWQLVRESDLPPSVTMYLDTGLEPVSTCCGTYDAMPRVEWGSTDGHEQWLDETPARGGALLSMWNAHPVGSLLFAGPSELAAGFVVIDLPSSE